MDEANCNNRYAVCKYLLQLRYLSTKRTIYANINSSYESVDVRTYGPYTGTSTR